MTKEERHLWFDFLRNYPVRFLRQKILGNYIVDFYCASAGVVIEIDGSQHFTADAEERDAVRTEYLKGYGIVVFRITNLQLHENFNGVCESIDMFIKERLRLFPADPPVTL